MSEQLIAVGILVVVYFFLITEKIHRSVVVLMGALAMVGLGILNEDNVINYIHWEALGLIFGMFIIVAALSETGFFRWIGLKTLKFTKYDPTKIFILYALLAAFLSAFMDSITVLIFMTSLTIEICSIMDLPPIPFIIAQISCANIGGSATMVGDPPNVVIGTALDLGFMDFVTHTGPIALVVILFNIVFFMYWYKKLFKDHKVDLEKIEKEHDVLDPFNAVTDVHLMRMALVVFVFTITLLVLHKALDVVVAFVGLLGASLILLFGGKDIEHVIEKIDWHTLIFLGSLFVIVGGLEETGALSAIADRILDISGGNMIILVTMILWVSALASAFLDNVPFAAAMVPVIREVSSTMHMGATSLAWPLALGCDIGGNGTPIGASANVVGLSVAAKKGVHISWKEYLKVAMPAMLISIAIINVLIFFVI